MAVALGPVPRFRAFDANGNPLAGGKLFTFATGTGTPLATYTDANGATPNPNPTILDSSGEANVWYTIGSSYRVRLTDATEAIVYYDIGGLTSGSVGSLLLIDDYSATITQMRELADPGEVGTESLATNAAGEITRNRAVMREMKGTTQWYETYTTRTTTGTFTLPSADGTWTPTGTTIAFYRFHIPDGWLPGSDVFLFYMRRAAGGGGTKARMTAQVLRHRNNTALAVLASADVDFQPADVQNHLGSILISGGSLAVGDFINVQITRLGDYVGPPGGDDDLPAVAPDGHYFQYTGIASR